MANTYGFDGRVALITGGASGIGAAAAERLRAGGADEDVQSLEAFDSGVELRRVAYVVAAREVEDVNLGTAGA